MSVEECLRDQMQLHLYIFFEKPKMIIKVMQNSQSRVAFYL